MADEKTLAEFELTCQSTLHVEVVRSTADHAHAHNDPTGSQLSIKTLTGEFARCNRTTATLSARCTAEM
jgi:hypothetical protein